MPMPHMRHTMQIMPMPSMPMLISIHTYIPRPRSLGGCSRLAAESLLSLTGRSRADEDELWGRASSPGRGRSCKRRLPFVRSCRVTALTAQYSLAALDESTHSLLGR